MKRAAQRSGRQPAAWQAAAAHGCDMALLERNLKLTPVKRVEVHSQALALVKALRRARIARHG